LLKKVNIFDQNENNDFENIENEMKMVSSRGV